MEDYLKFKKMITPIIIQIVFWVGIAGVVIASLFMMFSDGGFFFGLLMLIFGPIAIRMYTEIMILIFNMNDFLREISETLTDIKGVLQKNG